MILAIDSTLKKYFKLMWTSFYQLKFKIWSSRTKLKILINQIFINNHIIFDFVQDQWINESSIWILIHTILKWCKTIYWPPKNRSVISYIFPFDKIYKIISTHIAQGSQFKRKKLNAYLNLTIYNSIHASKVIKKNRQTRSTKKLDCIKYLYKICWLHALQYQE